MRTRAGCAGLVTFEALEGRALLAGGAAGALDVTFGDGGRVVHSLATPDDDRATAVAVLPDGRSIVAGLATSAAGDGGLIVRRFNADGSVDDSFGAGGRVVVRGESGFDHVGAVALTRDGGHVLVAGSKAGTARVVRLSVDGVLDRWFGRDGFGAVASRYASLRVTSVVELPGGKVLVGGSVDEAAGGLRVAGVALVRLYADGSSDDAYARGPAADFGGGGGRVVLTDRAARLEALTLAQHGGVVGVGGSGGDYLVFKLTDEGEFDEAFGPAGGGGVVGSDMGSSGDVAFDAVTLIDGSIVVVGSAGEDAGLVRLGWTGKVFVGGFGTGGKLRFDAGGTDVATGVTLMPDRRLVVTGTTRRPADGAQSVFAVRMASRGKVDRAFGDRGLLRFDFGGAGSTTAAAAAAAVAPGGRVVVAGWVGATPALDTAVARVTAGGKLDPRFGGGDGRVVAPAVTGPFIGEGSSARQADGKIVVAFRADGHAAGDAGVARFNADGSLDATFGDGGYAFFDLAGDMLSRVAVGPEGRIVLAAGTLSYDGGVATLRVAALTAAGRLDGSFGAGGVATVEFDGAGAYRPRGVAMANVVAFQGDKLLIGGAYSDHHGQFAVVRLTEAGARDASFGGRGDGVAVASFAPDADYPYWGELLDLTFAAGGKIVAVGRAGWENLDGPPQNEFALARFLSDGRVDASFGDGGVLETPDPAGTNQHATHVAVMADGRIVTAGFEWSLDGMSWPWAPAPADFVVRRYLADGAPDATYGDGGKVVVSFGGRGVVDDAPGGMIVRADGSAIVTGRSSAGGPWYEPRPAEARVALAKVTPAGTLDLRFGRGGRALTPTGLVAHFGHAPYQSTFAPHAGPGDAITVAGVAGNEIVLARYVDDAPGAVTASVDGGALRVRGGGGPDSIVVRRDGDLVEVLGVAERFAAAAFSRVEVDGLGGDDRIDLSRLAVPAVVDGGGGDDVVLTGSGDDSIFGGDGADTVFGGRGRDTLRGQGGNDYLNGGPGADEASGGAGDDQVFAVDGSVDAIDGGPGFDRAKTDVIDLLSGTEGVLA